MKRVFKYTLRVDDEQSVEMPQGARVLHVAEQHGRVQLWAMVDDEADKVARVIHMRGTGHPADRVATLPYIGCVQQHGGALIWHLFDGGESAS